MTTNEQCMLSTTSTGSTCAQLMSHIEDVKSKLTDQEYKKFCDLMMLKNNSDKKKYLLTFIRVVPYLKCNKISITVSIQQREVFCKPPRTLNTWRNYYRQCFIDIGLEHEFNDYTLDMDARVIPKDCDDGNDCTDCFNDIVFNSMDMLQAKFEEIN